MIEKSDLLTVSTYFKNLRFATIVSMVVKTLMNVVSIRWRYYSLAN